MKRYKIAYDRRYQGTYEDENGEWVKHDDARKLRVIIIKLLNAILNSETTALTLSKQYRIVMEVSKEKYKEWEKLLEDI